MNFLKQINRTTRAVALILSLILLVIPCSIAQLQLIDSKCVATSKTEILIDLVFEIEEGLYIQSNTPSDEFFIPTTFAVRGCQGMEIQQISFVGARERDDYDKDLGLSYFEDTFIVQITATDTEGPNIMSADLNFQACDPLKCFFPSTYPIELGWQVQQLFVYADEGME